MKKVIEDLREYLAVRLCYPRRWKNSKIASAVPSTLEIEDCVEIKKDVFVSSALKKIGAHTYIGNGSSVFECESIGRFCSISHGVKIGTSNHPLDHVSTNACFYSNSKGWINSSTFNEQEEIRCRVEHDVLISANSVIMNGVTLSTGCVIGAGSFVNTNVPPYAIFAGSPARLIRYRFNEDLVEQLLESRWWELPENELRSLSNHFSSPKEFIQAIRQTKNN